MERPLISIIVPVYNTEEYLPRCVKSLQDQTYPQLEILLVDDGSTDKSGALCDRLGEEDRRVRVFHKQNGGSSSARNLGIAEAKGEYLGFVDSDDHVEPDMYEKLYAAITQYGAPVAQTGRDEIDPDGNRLPDICVPPGEPVCIEAEDFLKELLMHRGDCSFCTKLIRRDVLEDREFPAGVLNEDFHLLVQLLGERIPRIASLPDRGYHVFYRVGSNSRKADRETFSRVYADNIDNADMVCMIVRDKYPQLQDIAFRFGIFQRIDYMLHIPISQMRKDNDRYLNVVRYLRKNWWRSMRNPILSGKNKVYHTLFAIAPRGIRRLHRKLLL
ncbi:MAG: glycosyltransferase [Lachnospiraceae bacterium]|nr:glycosyltransferase [Butyrivibrio sp.]MCM1342947.1 glycosyltransferase [Muribaculaceae bacterium]MCM1411393.1 glycosyltransferase [Lachnospiraceae bacterium]